MHYYLKKQRSNQKRQHKTTHFAERTKHCTHHRSQHRRTFCGKHLKPIVHIIGDNTEKHIVDKIQKNHRLHHRGEQRTTNCGQN